MTTTLENLREASATLSEQERATLRDSILRASHHSISWERLHFERKSLIRKQVCFFSQYVLAASLLSTRHSRLLYHLFHSKNIPVHLASHPSLDSSFSLLCDVW